MIFSCLWSAWEIDMMQLFTSNIVEKKNSIKNSRCWYAKCNQIKGNKRDIAQILAALHCTPTVLQPHSIILFRNSLYSAVLQLFLVVHKKVSLFPPWTFKYSTDCKRLHETFKPMQSFMAQVFVVFTLCKCGLYQLSFCRTYWMNSNIWIIFWGVKQRM